MFLSEHGTFSIINPELINPNNEPPTNFEIFLIFPNSLSLKSFGNS